MKNAIKTCAMKALAAVAAFVFAFTALADTEKVGNYTWTYTAGDGKASVGGGSSSDSAVGSGQQKTT